MKLGKIFLILLSLTAFLLLACRGGDGTYSGDEVYSDPNVGFEITPPEGWMESGVMEGSRFVTFVDSQGDTEPGIEVFHAYISVSSDSTDGLSFSEYMENAKENAKEFIPDLEYLTEDEIEVDGLPGEMVVTRLEEGEVEVVKMQILLSRNDAVYIVTGTSLASAWDKNEKIIRDSLLSFSFN
jgi:hypothetical protein